VAAAGLTGPIEKGEDRAGGADGVGEVEVVGGGIVEIDRAFDQAEPEHAGVEGDVGGGIVGHGGDVMEAQEIHAIYSMLN
jgi:hypothetical protein